MRRPHRKFHRYIWVALGLCVGVLFTLALVWRKPPPKPKAVAALETICEIIRDPAGVERTT